MITTLERSASFQHDQNARVFLNSLKAGIWPPGELDYGRWKTFVIWAKDTFAEAPEGHKIIAVTGLLNNLSNQYPELGKLLSDANVPVVKVPPDLRIVQPSGQQTDSDFPALPESAKLPEVQGASPLMDLYIKYSKQVSPEGFEQFHEGGFLSLLSTINARRTKIPFADKDYCSLMIVFVADTTDYAKTKTVSAVENVLESAGLRFLLGAGKTTPQRLIYEMSGIVPKDYSGLDMAAQDRVKQRLAFAGQRGWHSGEFGKAVKAMMNGQSVMADFQSLLLEMDDNKPTYENGTMARGNEIVEKPYLSVLGCATPANLKINGKHGSEFWTDGFWARMAFICPPEGTAIDAPFSLGEVPVPYHLSKALRDWHNRLGIPTVTIEPKKDEKGKETGHFDVSRSELQEEEIQFGPGVYDAWVRYRSALKQLAKDLPTKDLKGSYGRLATKTIRIASLLASLENEGTIELNQWALAQSIAERWRRSLHELYTQVNKSPVTHAKRIEDEILRIVQKLEEKGKPPTIRDMAKYLTRIDVGRIKQGAVDLVQAGLLIADRSEKATRYVTVEELSE